MSPSNHHPDSDADEAQRIDRLDFDAKRQTAARSQSSRHGGQSLLDADVDFMSEVAAGIVERDRERMRRDVIRTVSFFCAMISCLCAGSITTFSLYGPRFLEHLRYTQLQINTISIAAEIGLYLPVPLFGYLCDRYSPAPLSLFASLLFGTGYLLAAFTYRAGPPAGSGAPGSHGLPFPSMVAAFFAIGAGTACMYLSGVATCAKNFSRGKYRGLILALPIAAFGLSGMWQSQVGAHLLYERRADGSKGDVDVFKYFLFLGLLLTAVGVLGALGLRIVDEEKLIDRGVEELEQSGLLQDSEFFHTQTGRAQNYGTIDRGDRNHGDRNHPDDSSDIEADLSESTVLKKHQEEARLSRKKTWLLNHATSTFLSDRTMWLLAAGFFLVTGPGEAYINNVGTIIPTLTAPSRTGPTPAGTASTHVSIIALASTLARLLTGTLTDLFSARSSSTTPSKTTTTTTTTNNNNSNNNNQNPPPPPPERSPITQSRLTLLLASALLLSLSFLTLALPPLVPSHASLLPLSSALLGLGYGACFSLIPIIISVVWDVENFATNWGVVAMVPAPGAAVWGLVYSFGYARGAGVGVGDLGMGRGMGVGEEEEEGMGEGGGREVVGLCYGSGCFRGWAWGCAASVGLAMVLWGFAWRSWRRKGVVV